MNKPYLQNFFCTLIAFLAVTVSLTSTLPASGQVGQQAETNQASGIFRGAWFNILCPTDFTARPSLKSTTAEGYDSAEFTSSDGTVSFYVFAPQWSGNATDIALIPKREELVAEHRCQEQDRKIHWFTIAAKDGSYHRSYQETIAQQGSIKTIMGIKYRNEEARLRYMNTYELFRNSLKLYAD